jgi:hypothetical protein
MAEGSRIRAEQGPRNGSLGNPTLQKTKGGASGEVSNYTPAAAAVAQEVAPTVIFGNNPNQNFHTFRHVEEAGIDKNAGGASNQAGFGWQGSPGYTRRQNLSVHLRNAVLSICKTVEWEASDLLVREHGLLEKHWWRLNTWTAMGCLSVSL